ncbi:chemotaxis protein CheA [Candidatus Binatia bacterium]|nr:chemotaxis protein CheA [Candidatus Binatia bacterium]
MADATELDEVVREFLVESHEGLDQLDRDLVALEKDPTSKDRLASIFRTIHTIKGTCGFLSFGKLESVAHVGENLLSRLRDGRLTLNADITSALLAMVDAVRRMLADIEATGSDGDDDYAALVARLNDLQEALAPAAPDAEPRPSLVDEAVKLTASAAVEDLAPEPEPVPVSAPVAEHVPDVADASPLPTARAAEHPEAHSSSVADTTIRVDVHLLDKLMNLVGELVLARNQILQFTSTQDDTSFVATSQRLNLITTELQEGVMKTRMQPIGNIWAKFPRVVRDVALACGKQVRVEMDGRETELDKTIIEAIKDPLTHVVRNAVDHGIEAPEKRVAAGKPAEGRLFMRAFHEGGQVNIEISDDGGGIDPEKLKQKALQRGLVHPDQLARMGEREILNLIFLPGFSTAEKITNVSGRGVGMDVVKTNIEKIGGTVDIQSKVGHGTTLKVKIPLTLAIIPALVVTSGGERYAIPQVSLLELVRLEGDQARRAIESIHGAPVYRLRGNLLPLAYLSRELGHDATTSDGAAVNIVVLQADGRQFGLVVEGISDTEEIVVKPLGKQLKSITSFAGATIMGDGKVALILDVMGLAQRAHVLAEGHDRAIADDRQASDATNDAGQELRTLLLLGVGDSGRLAVPLDLVDRLEEIEHRAIEWSAGQEVVQYRGQILPLVRLCDMLGTPRPEDGEMPLQVVVATEQGQTIGIVVDRILDIVEDRLEVRRGTQRHGLLGSAVIQNKVTDLLDVRGIVCSVASDLSMDDLELQAAAAA